MAEGNFQILSDWIPLGFQQLWTCKQSSVVVPPRWGGYLLIKPAHVVATCVHRGRHINWEIVRVWSNFLPPCSLPAASPPAPHPATASYICRFLLINLPPPPKPVAVSTERYARCTSHFQQQRPETTCTLLISVFNPAWLGCESTKFDQYSESDRAASQMRRKYI